MPLDERYRPAPRFAELGEGFADAVDAANFPKHELRFRHQRAAERVGLGALDETEWEAHFARFEPLPDNLPSPLALRYHGHQFRSYNPELGDGRGFLAAQLLDPEDERLLDLGTKGSGRTPWSRGGDGRLTLKGAVREVLATEMLEALGVCTSKTFSVFETGEQLMRGDEPSPTRSAVMVRLSHGHIRFGSFQRHAFDDEHGRLRELLEYSVAQYYPDLGSATDLPLAFFDALVPRMAELAASYMAAGFVHGVLNTDNMNITGESFDYGPWRFLPHYDPTFTAAYFDRSGLYAYERQPEAIFWNLARLAEALAPLSPSADWESSVATFVPSMRDALHRKMLARLGVASIDAGRDASLLESMMAFLQKSRVGFAPFFHDWVGGSASEERARSSARSDSYQGDEFAAFHRRLMEHDPVHPERLKCTYLQRAHPCDMLIGEVEEIWRHIEDGDDWEPLEWKVADIRAMGEALSLL